MVTFGGPLTPRHSPHPSCVACCGCGESAGEGLDVRTTNRGMRNAGARGPRVGGCGPCGGHSQYSPPR